MSDGKLPARPGWPCPAGPLPPHSGQSGQPPVEGGHGCRGARRRSPTGPARLTPPAPSLHLSIHLVPTADFKKRLHGFQGCHVPLVDVLGGELEEEVPEVPDQGLGVALWIELPGEVTG